MMARMMGVMNPHPWMASSLALCRSLLMLQRLSKPIQLSRVLLRK